MFPLPSDLAELASRSTIQLAETPFPLLLVAHHAAESTGLLTARRGPIEKRVVLDGGVPVDCRSNLAHETFSRFLAATGRLSAEDAHSALSRSLAQGTLFGEMLVAEGRMEAPELHRLLQQSLARKLFDLFTWREGDLTFEPGAFATPAALKVKVARLVLTGVERFVPQETIDRAIGPFAGALFARHPDTARTEELRPTERERKLLAALAQPRRLEELLPVAELPLAELSRTIWGLALLGLVIPADRLAGLGRRSPGATPPSPTAAADIAPAVAARSAPATAAPPAPAVPEVAALATPPAVQALPGPSPEEPARIRERVATAFAELRHQDPLDLLAAHDSETTEEIRARFIDFARQFAPWQFTSPELRSAAPAAEELFAAGAIAFARLSDAKEREALRSARRWRRGESVQMLEPGQTAEPAPPAETAPPIPPAVPPAPSPRSAESAAAAPAALPPSPAIPFPFSSPAATHRASAASFRIETDLLDPALQYKKGRALKEAQRWSQALQQFDFAADCDPQNGAYRAEAAHCRFLLAPTTMGGKALDELREAQRIDPDSITPYLYAGEIAAQLGRFEEAESHLRSAARRLGPADRRALDALRDLAKKRKR